MTEDMTQFLHDQFEIMAEAPGGVQRLRELILQLAVTGRLGTGDEKDEPANLLLKQIVESAKSISFEHYSKNLKKICEKDEHSPFGDLPKSWELTKLGYIALYNYGIKGDESKIADEDWVLDLEDIEKNSSRVLQKIIFKDRLSKSTKTKFEIGDVLYGKLRPYLNKVVVADSSGYCTTEIVPIKVPSGINPYYLKTVLKSPYFLAYVNRVSYGMKMPRLGTEDAINATIPLPPFAEQQRIVEKVDSLMALCDDLEAKQTQKHTHLVRLGTGSLTALQQSDTQEELVGWWGHLQDNFGLIFDCVENVETLRQTILNLAVVGRLTNKLNLESQSLSNTPINILKNENIVIDTSKMIPDYWDYKPLKEIAQIQGGIQKQPKRIPMTNYYPYLRVANVLRGRLDLSEVQNMELFNGELEKYRLFQDDLLIVEGNGSLSEVGRCAIWTGKILNCVHQNHIIRVRVTKALPEFINLFWNSSWGCDMAMKSAITTSGLYSISVKKISLLTVPIPPLEEQKKIVELVNLFKVLCDQLEQKVENRSKSAILLSNATIQQIIGVV